MTVRKGAVSGGRRWLVAALVALFVCCSATVALAASGAVLTTSNGQLGTMVAARNGHTLYLFHQDWAGKSYCYGACAAVWRPDITNGRPTISSGSGLNPSLLGTIRRRNGAQQVTYNRHPLYLYTGDKSAGTMRGEGRYQFHGYWYAVGIKGKAIKPFNPGGY